MSKAFIFEDTVSDEVVFQPLNLTEGSENYMTSQGFQQMKAELSNLQHEKGAYQEDSDGLNELRLKALEQRIQYLQSRIEIARIIEPGQLAKDRVVFGSRVKVETEDGEIRNYQLVGIDETDAKAGKISWISPIGKALLQAKVGDAVSFQAPRGWEELQVLEIEAS